MGQMEDHYANPILDHKAREAAQQRERVQEINRLLPQVTRHFNERPPAAASWILEHGQKRAVWDIAQYVFCESTKQICLRPDGTLIRYTGWGNYDYPAASYDVIKPNANAPIYSEEYDLLWALVLGLRGHLPPPPKRRWWQR